MLEQYFRGICYEVGYERARDESLIAPYRLAFVSVPLSPPEREDYDSLTDSLRKLRSKLVDGFGVPAEPWGSYFSAVSNLAGGGCRPAQAYLGSHAQRRSLLAEAANKITLLGGLAGAVRQSGHAMIFTQTVDASEEAVAVLQREGCESFAIHCRLDDSEREETLRSFAEGELHAVAAPHLLDEGVDFPEADLGIVMAANRSRRQMIQRLGRVLRPGPDKLARFVIMFAGNTVEDSTIDESNDFYSICRPYAAACERFDLENQGEIERVLRFLGYHDDPTDKPHAHPHQVIDAPQHGRFQGSIGADTADQESSPGNPTAQEPVILPQLAAPPLTTTTLSGLLRTLDKQGIVYNDLRSKGGCLWVYGGPDLGQYLEAVAGEDAVFSYGYHSRYQRHGWWTRSV